MFGSRHSPNRRLVLNKSHYHRRRRRLGPEHVRILLLPKLPGYKVEYGGQDSPRVRIVGEDSIPPKPYCAKVQPVGGIYIKVQPCKDLLPDPNGEVTLEQ